jgi:hypothetical protein
VEGEKKKHHERTLVTGNSKSQIIIAAEKISFQPFLFVEWLPASVSAGRSFKKNTIDH